MQGMLATLVDELRSVGIGVSVGEHLDAAQALSRISLLEKDVVRAALLGTLIKRAEHIDTFNLLFNLVTAEPREAGAELVAALSDEQLRETLRQAIRGDDDHLLRLLADEYVRRYGGLEPGRPGSGVFATIGGDKGADLQRNRAELLESAQGAGYGGRAPGAGARAGLLLGVRSAPRGGSGPRGPL